MIDSAEKRGKIIRHLEAAMELADELQDGETTCPRVITRPNAAQHHRMGIQNRAKIHGHGGLWPVAVRRGGATAVEEGEKA
jgi:hypothetical protein